jgi:glycosyltransferase involved in cell wall biosynthesis
MHQLRVAFVHNLIAPYRHPLFERLSRSYDLTVYYCSAKRVSHKWDRWPRTYDYKYRVLPRIPIGELSLNPSIVSMLALRKPDVIVLGEYEDPTTWLAFIVCKFLKIPIIQWTEGIKEPKSILGAITRPIREFFTRKSCAVVVPGRLSRRYLMTLGARSEAVFTAPNAIDYDLFASISSKCKSSKDSLKGKLGLRGRTVILYVGQLIKRKGVEYLLRAYARLAKERNGISLVLVGSGSLEPQLMKLADRLRLRNFIIIHSGLSQKELIELYSVAGILVLPTLEDVWGFVINEGMACGLPVVSTGASQAAQEMIRSGENGYVVKEADPEDLYKALRNILSNPSLGKRMGERSKEILRREFSVLQMVEGFISAIEYCTKKST